MNSTANAQERVVALLYKLTVHRQHPVRAQEPVQVFLRPCVTASLRAGI